MKFFPSAEVTSWLKYALVMLKTVTFVGRRRCESLVWFTRDPKFHIKAFLNKKKTWLETWLNG